MLLRAFSMFIPLIFVLQPDTSRRTIVPAICTENTASVLGLTEVVKTQDQTGWDLRSLDS
jgi:hypothetical protein